MQWRLIPLLNASGATQMAIDRWLWEQCHQGQHPPTLRFYTWTPAAISLGRNQLTWPEHWQGLTWQSNPIDLVRRPTGGRAVLHSGDLTYAIALPYPHRNRRQAYQELCQFLIAGWQHLGIKLQFGEPRRNYIRQANCFATATNADLILDNGYKLIGSAQAWQGHTVLQHGSMRLNPSPALIEQVFSQSAVPPETTRPETAHPIGTKLPPVSEAEIIDALVAAAQTCFQATFTATPLSADEQDAIRQQMAKDIDGSAP